MVGIERGAAADGETSPPMEGSNPSFFGHFPNVSPKGRENNELLFQVIKAEINAPTEEEIDLKPH